jgi:GNAT superfamily N-acetyltransferase
MINEIFELYKQTLPELVRSEAVVRKLLSDPNNHIISHRADGRLVGVCVINDNTIYLLCVDKAFQNRGIGTGLLKESEKYIAAGGYGKVVLGVGKDYIMSGVPINDGVHQFFIKFGYTNAWGSLHCVDMAQKLSEFDYDEHSVGDTINGVTYRWAAINDLDRILICCADNEEDFSVYYRNEDYYKKDTNLLVLIAEKGNEVLSTLGVAIGFECEDMGCIGLTATAIKHRKQGIATNTVLLATKYLKDIGLKKAHLGYTYIDLINMYSRAKYKVCMEYFMGEKPL